MRGNEWPSSIIFYQHQRLGINTKQLYFDLHFCTNIFALDCVINFPDEFVFQTILFNSIYKEDIVNDNMRFIDWSEGNKNPKTFTAKDVNILLASNQFFARKFDVNVDAEILDLVDQKRNSLV